MMNTSLPFENGFLTQSSHLRNNSGSIGFLFISKEAMDIENTRVTLKKIGLPVLILLGTIGNAFALAVLQRSSTLKQSSICYYLKAFFVMSILVLYLGAGLDWVCLMAEWPHLWDVTDGLCRIWHFFCNVVFFSPIWLCVAMAVDRYISICHHSTAEKMCNVFTAKIVIISLQIGLILVSIHAMWTYELHSKFGCTVPYGQRDFHSIVWPWVSVIIYTFLPLSLLLLFNTVLLVGLCSKNKCQNSTNNSRSPDNGKLTSATLMVCCTFLLLALPATIMNVYMQQAPPSWIKTQEMYHRLQLTAEIFQQLVILNHAIMGIVCFISSAVFRKETYRLFMKKTERLAIELSPDEQFPEKYCPKKGSCPVTHTDNSKV